MRLRRITGLVGVAALALVAVGCGSDDSGGSDTTAAAAGTEAPASTEAPAGSESPITTGELKPVKLQPQWVTQAQFAGYYALSLIHI